MIFMNKTLIQRLEDTIQDIKDDFDDGGAADALDMLVRHFKEIEDDA